jgi:HD-like signal output (HDOD) protein/DNA-binding response OmpR family regulator
MPSGLRALVVDDEVAMQRLGSHALRQQGFQCECVSDGEEALVLCERTSYDLVVTELTLPKKSGYALILDLLKLPTPPVIVVYTDVVEPRLVKDLLFRGVDDVLSKPVHGAFLAGKARALVDRRVENAVRLPIAPPAGHDAPAAEPDEGQDEGLPITFTRLNRRLLEVTSILPVSSAALDVFEMTRGCDWEVAQIAAAIQRDPSLTADVLKLANSHLCNPTGKRILDLDQAVMRIGQNRVGELALAASALSKLTPEVLPWLDLEVTWKRSMAAGLVMESLIEAGGHQGIEEGLLLSAIMYPLGRVALGMLFPEEYQELAALCESSGESLQEQERRSLPTTHVQVMAHLLASWNIPPDVFLPLKFAQDEYSSLARLSEPLRTKTELVKVAVVLGRLATGRWHSWDLVQLPPTSVLKRLRIANVTEVLEGVIGDLEKLAEFSLHPKDKDNGEEPTKPTRSIPYYSFTEQEQDLFAALLPSLGFEPERSSREALPALQGCLLNCLAIPPKRLADQKVGDRAAILASQDRRESFSRLGKTITLPSSYGCLRADIHEQLAYNDDHCTGARGSWLSKISRPGRVKS